MDGKDRFRIENFEHPAIDPERLPDAGGEGWPDRWPTPEETRRELISMRDEQTNIRLAEKGVDYGKHDHGPAYDDQLREAAAFRTKDPHKGRHR